MSHSTPVPISNRTILLRVVPLLTLLLVNILFLAMLDSLFAMQKRAVIIDSKDRIIEFDEQLDPIKRPLLRLANQHQNNPEQYMSEAIAFLDEQADEFLQGDHPWIRLTLDDENRQRLAEYSYLAKKGKFNNAGNSLFSRTFEAPAAFPAIYLTAYYATPRGWPAVEAMVLRYWVYALLFIISSLLIYWRLDRRVLLPLQRVGRSIESMIQPGNVTLIENPVDDIEIAYNRMARVQREVYLGVQIEEVIDQLHSLSDNHAVVEKFLSELIPILKSLLPLQQARAYVNIGKEKKFVFHAGDPTSAPMPPWPESTETTTSDHGTIRIPLVPADHVVGCVELLPRADKLPADEWPTIAQEIQKQCVIGLSRAMTRSRALTEERNRFGINLATNMGHDLTNIIATSKWDMNTIHRAMKAGVIQVDESRGAFFGEAIAGLKNNLSFLQEMVDIYRSFGSIRRPNYSLDNVCALIEETGRLFRLSSSQKFDLNVEAPGSVVFMLEPRLLRMALFNLLSNAVQAVRRSDMPIETTRIRIRILHHEEAGHVEIQVCDNGPGIRNADGSLMTPEQIPRIFQSGFTTKEVDSGGGLGLAWVKSIIEDYHSGTIEASNPEDGGACFTVSLPVRQTVLEHAPDPESPGGPVQP